MGVVVCPGMRHATDPDHVIAVMTIVTRQRGIAKAGAIGALRGLAPLTVQKELMRHASIQTTMNIHGNAMTDSKRQAHSKVVESVLNGGKPGEKISVAAIGT